MNKQVLLWSVVFAIGIVAVLALVWILVCKIIEVRRVRHAKQRHADWEREMAKQGRVPNSEMEHDEDS